MTADHPRPAAANLLGYSVETISRADATPIIVHYEWLRTVGRATIFVGLMSPQRELQGVACFGAGPGGEILVGRPFGGGEGPPQPAMCLERGACVHYAPPNAASFLINAACKLVYRFSKIPLFFAYADPMAGEYGGVYQAAGWVYLGQGLDGGKGRKHRYFVLQPGRDRNDPAAWQTTRELRRKGFTGKGSFDKARAAKWEIGLRAGKHVYAINVGRDNQRWHRELLAGQRENHGTYLPYPAPRPELKLRARIEKATDAPVFKLTSPLNPQLDLLDVTPVPANP
jgi:hypothetical protein